MNRPAQNTRSPKATRTARILPRLACAALLLAAASATSAQDIAVYGGEVGVNEVTIYNQAGTVKGLGLFETAIGSGVYSVNDNIEDIAYDAYGRLYAIGKPGSSGLRTVYKSLVSSTLMKILFHTAQNYDASVDGSIAISPSGDVAIYGACNTAGVGSSLKVFNQDGVALKELLFQNGVGSAGAGISLTIEDIAYDAAGTLYAVGKDHLTSPRTIFKEGAGKMQVLFQETHDYVSTVDGSIAISPTGDISVFGAQSPLPGGTSLQTFNQAGTKIGEWLFQNTPGGGSWSINTRIEDIAYDGDGTLYAVGQPNSTTKRTVFKKGAIGMDIFIEGSGFTSSVDASIAIKPSTAWTPLNGGIFGVDGLPELEATGTLSAGPIHQLRLSHAVPNSIATLFVGFSAVNLQFKGGLFIPQVALVVSLATGADGSVTLPYMVPVGVPPGVEIYLQSWQPDPAAFQDYAASNGLKGITP